MTLSRATSRLAMAGSAQPRRGVLGGSGGLPGLRVLSRNSPSTPSAMNRACGSAAAVGGGKDNLGAPHVLLWCAAIRNDRLKPEAIRSPDVDDNSCSHNESLDCFGRFGNRQNESDH
jgi:hypothetical protein